MYKILSHFVMLLQKMDGLECSNLKDNLRSLPVCVWVILLSTKWNL